MAHILVIQICLSIILQEIDAVRLILFLPYYIIKISNTI